MRTSIYSSEVPTVTGSEVTVLESSPQLVGSDHVWGRQVITEHIKGRLADVHRCKAVGLLGGKEKSPPLLSSQDSSVGYYRMRAEEHRQLTFVAQQFSMRCSR